MKALKLFSILTTAILALSSFSVTDADTLIVKKGAVKINGMSIPSDWSLSEFQNALGSSDREREGYNKTHTYDLKGIVLFESMKDKMPSGKISEFQYYLSEITPNEVTPKGLYSGTITIDKVNLTADITFTELKAKLKKWKQTDSYIEHSYRLAKSGLYMYFQFNDSDTRLQKISIGKDKGNK